MREEIERLSGDTYVVLLTELLGERGAHDVATNAGRSAEVRLARLAAGGVDGWEGIVNYFFCPVWLYRRERFMLTRVDHCD